MTKEIKLANPRGFCAGVDRAIDIVNINNRFEANTPLLSKIPNAIPELKISNNSMKGKKVSTD